MSLFRRSWNARRGRDRRRCHAGHRAADSGLRTPGPMPGLRKESAMSAIGETSYTVVPAWWDPHDRKVIFNPSTVVCGVLFAGGGHLAFAGPDGIGFEAAIADVAVTWKKMNTGLRLRTPDGVRLVYLLPPVDGVDRVSRDALDAVAGHLTTSSDVAGLVDEAADLGSVGELLDWAGVLGGSLKMVSQYASLRVARRSRQALEPQLIARQGR